MKRQLICLVTVTALGLYGCSGADFKGDADEDSGHAHSAHNANRVGDTSRVMGSIDVGDGEHAGDVNTVNGSVHVGDRAVVGKAETVNGGITIGEHATVSAVQTVNGSIRLQEGAGVSGEVQSVNGSLTVANGADVKGELANVNGAIKVAAAHIGGDVQTVTGDIQIGPNAHLDGGIHVERDNSWFHTGSNVPRVVIGPGTVIKGTLRFDRKVDLFVSERATIGEVVGATATRFSGDQPGG